MIDQHPQLPVVSSGLLTLLMAKRPKQKHPKTTGSGEYCYRNDEHSTLNWAFDA